MEEPLGWNERFGGYVIPVPSNMHVHFRFDPAMMELVIQETAKHYRYVTAMPNFGKDRIRMPEQAIAYRERVLTIARKYDPNFNLNVPLYLEPNTSPDTVREGFELGAWIAAKLYPRGGTNGSEEGVDFQKLCELEPVFKTMEELGMLLLIHAEPTEHKDGSGIVNWKREQASLGLIGSILRKHSNLHVVFEHISSAAGARAIRQWQRKGCRVEATIAPQYLLWNATKLFAGGMNPLYYSIPILKEEEDRLALITFLLEGGGFLGTDSAPHDLKAKQQGYRCPGGIFNETVALFVYFKIFKESGRADWFEKFVDFACRKGPAFYRLDPPQGQMLIVEKSWQVPTLFSCNSEGNVRRIMVEPMFAGETMEFSVSRLI